MHARITLSHCQNVQRNFSLRASLPIQSYGMLIAPVKLGPITIAPD
jgi:hypothetical protein